ncbi:MAG: hypothetical protein ABW136_04710 [Steroidobacteraceae bacterium]
MLKQILLAGLLTGVVTAQAGTSGVLLADLPSTADRAATLAAVRTSFEGRGWVVESATADSVTARILRAETRSRMTVSVSGSALRYEEVTRHTHRGVGSRPTKQPVALYSEAPLHGTWIANLRSDVAERLAR